MKAKIHPEWHPEAKVKCACGNTFTVGATVPEIEVEVCNECHPFYTGQMKYVDTAGRVDSFKEKRKKAKDEVLSKTEKRKRKKEARKKKVEDELSKPETLDELRDSLKKTKK